MTLVGHVAQPAVLVPLFVTRARKPCVAGFGVLLGAICLAHVLSERLAQLLVSPDRQGKDRVSFGQIAPNAVPARVSPSPDAPLLTSGVAQVKLEWFLWGTHAGGFPTGSPARAQQGRCCF